MNLRNVPTGAWIFASVAVLGGMAALVVLAVTGASSADFWRFVNLAWNGLQLLVTSGAVVYAGAAARNGQQAVEQTNGVQEQELRDVANKAAIRAVALHRANNRGE